MISKEEMYEFASNIAGISDVDLEQYKCGGKTKKMACGKKIKKSQDGDKLNTTSKAGLSKKKVFDSKNLGTPSPKLRIRQNRID